MLTRSAIDALDCEKLSRDPFMRRRIIPTVRAFFAQKYGDFDASMNDVSLLRFSRAKYHDRPFDETVFLEDAEEVHRRFENLYYIPDHLCSWFKEALKLELSEAL